MSNKDKEFYQLTLDLRKELRGNAAGIKALNTISQEIRDLTNKSSEPEEKRNTIASQLFRKFSRLLENENFFQPPLTPNAKGAFQIAARNIIRQGLDLPVPNAAIEHAEKTASQRKR